MIVASALVLLMTPGLALFYGGMVRRQNVLSTMLHSLVLMGTVTVLWVLVGYTLAFGPSKGWIGGLDFLGGSGVSVKDAQSGLAIPQALFMLYQMMFAIITPGLISGAIAERMRFGAYVAFTSLWLLIVYVPVACWVWNADGWLFKMGTLDFAGGTVVHLASGASALACCIALGRRRALEHREPILPNNLTLTLLGAGLLWFGWIGFNAGSAYAVNDLAVRAFLTTQLAAGAGLLGWLVVERVRFGKPTALGAASGLVAGLVGITPAAGFVEPGAALLIGLLAGGVCALAVSLKTRFGFDDSLDVVGVHGAGGALGAILTGVLASASANPAGATALEGGRMSLVLKQALAVGVVGVFAFTASYLLTKIIAKFTPVRASEEEEAIGLDLSLHGESGYNL
ncbi:MAG: ammonium transporter [Armatimonadetes bacterium]|nr:ammonium transporter [Armatimonadota bacterium]